MTPVRKIDMSTPAIGRHQALRHLLSLRQLRDSVRLQPLPSLHIALVAAMQAALAVLLALVVARLSPWPQLVGPLGLGALAALFGRFAAPGRRMRIVGICAVMLCAAVFVPSLASWAGMPAQGMVAVLALVAGAATLAVSHWRLGGPGAVIVVFAAGASLAPVHSGQQLLERTLGTLAGGLLAALVCWATDGLRHNAVQRVQLPAQPQQPWPAELAAAGRIVLGAGLAAWVAQAAGWQHPAWAAIGATAVMQGSHLHITMNRALQRMVGTMLGALVAGLILALDPSFWWIAAAIVALQFITEVSIGYNYALGQITVTPMALLMTHLASSPQAPLAMPLERVLDTVLGAALGIVFARALSSLEDRTNLHRLHHGEGSQR
ncbi:FUSC family protein [Comamonas koreensis]|uniref:FUSC family protein n=1 Tax=Comamonas koreensis TaxID=160825 RepID=UPI001E3850E1|nr:FUSC family protein [Comamonas koreensis]